MQEMGVSRLYASPYRTKNPPSRVQMGNTLLEGESQINASKTVNLVYSVALITSIDNSGRKSIQENEKVNRSAMVNPSFQGTK